MKGLFYLGIFREVCDKLPRYQIESSFLKLAFSLGCQVFNLKNMMQLNEPLAKFVTLVSFVSGVVKTLREKLELLKRCSTVRNKTRNRYLKWKCLSYQRFPNGLYTWWDYYIVSQYLKLPTCHLPGNTLMWIYPQVTCKEKKQIVT